MTESGRSLHLEVESIEVVLWIVVFSNVERPYKFSRPTSSYLLAVGSSKFIG